MKSLLKTIIPSLVLLIGTAAFGQTKIGTVDLGRVFTNYWKFKTAQGAIEDRKADLDKTYKEMADTYKKSRDEYQKLVGSVNDQAVSSEERDRRRKAAEDKAKDIKDQEDSIRQFETQARTTLDEQLRRMRENILGEIRVVVNAKAKAGGYTLVVDTAAQATSATPIVLYNAPGESDLTKEVIDQLNLNAPGETPAAAEKPAEKPAAKPEKK